VFVVCVVTSEQDAGRQDDCREAEIKGFSAISIVSVADATTFA
jgi:hypothetical protein